MLGYDIFVTDTPHPANHLDSGESITGIDFPDDPKWAIGRESLDFTRAVPLVNTPTASSESLQ